MIKEVKKDIIQVLKQASTAIKQGKPAKVKLLSNQTIHNAGIYQDQDSLSVAIIVYAISKLMERGFAKTENIVSQLSNLILALQKDNFKDFRYRLRRLFKSISKDDKKLGLYIEEVINQADIKKGSKLFEHGFSIGKAADMLGITQWELMGYIGKTQLPEKPYHPDDVTSRLDLARKIFGV